MKSYPKVSDRKIRIAIVGCGRISKNHFSSVERHHDNIELVSVCDVQQDVLSKYEAEYKVKGYLDLEQMLENEKLDLVVFCTPSGIHAKQTEICAKHGVNVMTEKPMATEWSDGVRMVKACDEIDWTLLGLSMTVYNAVASLLLAILCFYSARMSQ